MRVLVDEAIHSCASLFQDNESPDTKNMTTTSVSHDLWTIKQRPNIAKVEENVKESTGGVSDRVRNLSTRSSQRIKENFAPIKPNASVQNRQAQDMIKQVI